MSISKKRNYNSDNRKFQAQKTKERILISARKLFEKKGFDKVTIEKIAQSAKVSVPLIYSIFQSKSGILLSLMDEALSPEQYQAMVEEAKNEKNSPKRFDIAAKIARQLYDAEKTQLTFLHGAAVLCPEVKEIEMGRESRRYYRQEETITTMMKENVLVDKYSITDIRDIFWALTGRDMYRMLVIERGWSSDKYEKWLGEFLVLNFIKK